jgi:hypothetical protein
MSCARVPSDIQPSDGYEFFKHRKENYDPNQPVCNNQADFNQAFRKALRYNVKEEMKKDKAWMAVYIVIWLIFFVWAIMLALKVPVGPERTEHLLFAIVVPPAYVLAHYIGVAGKPSMGSMGFRLH